jgi:hypothetical protein
MIYKVNTINTANRTVQEREFADYNKAVDYHNEQCEKYNIEEKDIDKPLEPDADLSSGGRGYDVIIDLNCIDC